MSDEPTGDVEFRRPDDEHMKRLFRAFEAQRTILDRTRPWATGGLAATIAGVFGLQLWWGAGDPLAPLYAMGSLVPDDVRAGAWWRVISSAFLHAGWSHVAFNVMALWILGSFVEKVVGARRMVVLVLTSAIGGNLASLVIHDSGQSVGASGGIWGLLGAGAVLGFAGRGVLHPVFVPGVRRAAGINLGLNVLVSFLPQVNMAAHFGGGAVGAILVLSGALTRGLPRFGPGDDFERPRTTPTWISFAAAAAILAAALGVGLAWHDGQPWISLEARLEVRWETVDLDRIGVRADVPASLPVELEPREGEVRVIRYGNLRDAPLAVRIAAAARDDGGQAPEPADAIDELHRELADPPPGFTVRVEPRTIEGPTGTFVVVRWAREADGTVLEVAALRLPHQDVVVYAGYGVVHEDRYGGTAERIGRSIRPLASAAPRATGGSGLR